MTEVALTIRASQILPGDFVEIIEPKIVHGPRGGRYRWAGLIVGRRIVAVDPRPYRDGFKIVVERKGITGPHDPVVLPGNLADLVDARVRRTVGADAVRHLDDGPLLALVGNTAEPRALRLAAEAELDRRTR